MTVFCPVPAAARPVPPPPRSAEPRPPPCPPGSPRRVPPCLRLAPAWLHVSSAQALRGCLGLLQILAIKFTYKTLPPNGNYFFFFLPPSLKFCRVCPILAREVRRTKERSGLRQGNLPASILSPVSPVNFSGARLHLTPHISLPSAVSGQCLNSAFSIAGPKPNLSVQLDEPRCERGRIRICCSPWPQVRFSDLIS